MNIDEQIKTNPYANILSVGKDKHGEWDFSVRATVGDLDYKEMDKMRSMLVVGIGVMEDMWRRAKEEESPQPVQERPPQP